MQWRLLLFLTLMVLVVVFSIANAAPVPFHYLVGEGSLSLALIIIISALIGAVAGVLSNLSSQIKLQNALHDKDKQLRELNRDKTELNDELEARRVKRRKKGWRNRG
jgi:uncharacterized integral membrane protein